MHPPHPEDRGYVADSDIDGLVEYLKVPRIQIEEVLLYTQFRRAPIGRWHVETCRNVSCSMCGAERLMAHLKEKLGIGPARRRRTVGSHGPPPSAWDHAARRR